MKLPYKITLITISAILLIASFAAIFNGFYLEAFYGYYGYFAIGAGFITGFMALLALFRGRKQREYALGFGLSAAILLLTGFFMLMLLSANEFGR